MAEGRRGRWASQTLRCKIHNLIQLSKLPATSWAPRTLSLARPVHSQKLRSKGRSLSLYLYLYLSPATFAIRASCFEISPLSSPRFILPDFLSVPPAEYRTFWLLDQRFWLVVHLEWNEEAGFRCSRPSNRLG